MTQRDDGAGEYAVWHGPKLEYSPLPIAVLTDHLLSHATVRVYGYMLGVVTRPASCNPDGRWILRRRDVMRRCQIGEDAWTRAARELTRAGLYRGERTRLPRGATEIGSDGAPRLVGGQQRYVHHIYPASRAYHDDGTRLHTPPPGKPGGGASPGGEATPLDIGMDTSIQTQQRTRAPSAAKAAAPAGKKYEKRPSGIETWDAADRAAAKSIEDGESAEAIAAGVASLRAAGKNAVPGSVRSEIGRQERLARQAAAAQAADAARARQNAEKERRRAQRASKLRLDLAAYHAALERAGSYRDAVLLSTYNAAGTPGTWVPRPEWGLSDQDAAAIRAFIPDRQADEY